MQLDLFAALQDDDTPTPTPPPAPALAPATFRRSAATPHTEPRTTVSPAAQTTHTAAPRALPTGKVNDPAQYAFNLGEAVANTWHKNHGGTRIEIPIGIVASLALIGQKDKKGPDLKAQILAQNDQELWAMYREIWATNWRHRPDLVERARILHEWANEEKQTRHELYVVRAVTKTVLDKGLLDLTGHADPYLRARADVLSPTLTMMRSTGATKGLGEYHTPPPVAEAMAIATLSTLSADSIMDGKKLAPGQSFLDPAAGTGGMMRAAAQNIREQGLDPAAFRWAMVDIDPIAAACAAVNAMVWALGPRVTVACADSLANPRAVEDAHEEARAAFEHRDRILGQLQMVAAVRRAQQFLEKTVGVAA
ncbi:SAM-dependent methyltransferase [Streptomyces sp. NBC_00237]|uniref:N-6 DNA methylase n=1 Tax=Streptomyces sp. NBC_00237 TaxID=2975687 RepID=UPI002254E2C8|nr:N-6 DNA methylase [Streptomyces sp. NBC_00237]MCX5206688.1 SAM-dependent methyltransferase [Streptomyces sp. NBC_00237]